MMTRVAAVAQKASLYTEATLLPTPDCPIPRPPLGERTPRAQGSMLSAAAARGQARYLVRGEPDRVLDLAPVADLEGEGLEPANRPA